MKHPATTKITIYVCKWREREFCKVWFTYRGKIRGKNPNVSKHWLHADTQVHVQIAKMRQTLAVVTAQPAAESCCVTAAVERYRCVHSKSGTTWILQLETSTSGSSRNYAAWFPVALYFVVDYPRLIRGKSWIKLFLWSGHPVWILQGLIIQFTFLFCLSFSEALIWMSVFCTSARLSEICPNLLSVKGLQLSGKCVKLASLLQSCCGTIYTGTSSAKPHLLRKPGFIWKKNITPSLKQ